MTLAANFWELAAISGLVGYFHGHQGSHIAAVKAGQAKLSPIFLVLLVVYNWLSFVPWLILGWYGYKTVWWYALVAIFVGWMFQLVFVKAEVMLGLAKSAWAISLAGIPLIPVALIVMAEVVAAI